ncbi:MAG: Kelch repeat-containing protein [Verrucomicrobiales bacterium]|nr:Kelch repeat-containing protein [Verrucomicrobiales bacterium]
MVALIFSVAIARRLMRTALFLLVLALLTAQSALAVGSWTKLTASTPSNAPVQLMLLLPDGTVMAAGSNITNTWYKLTPDTNGSYVNGKWSTLRSMASTRLYYASVVLRDGRVFVAGAEYGTGAATAEIYNPLTDVWTTLTVPTNVLDSTKSWGGGTNNQAFFDSGAVLLADGRVLIEPVYPQNLYDTVIYDPVGNTWSSGPTARAGNQDEASWIKLPDESILTVDSGSTTAERYLPVGYLTNHVPTIASNRWIADATVPIFLYDSIGSEIGPGMLLANGTAFLVGANGNSAIYTPSGDNTQGSWQIGPALPNVIKYPLDNNGNELTNSGVLTAGAAPDAPAASLVNGQVLYAFSGALYNDPRAGTQPAGATNNYWTNTLNPIYPAPTSFFVYNPPTKTFAPIAAPTGTVDDIPTYKAAMLTLPDGSVLYAHEKSDLYVYTLDPLNDPNDQINPTSRPTIQSLSNNGDGSWHLTGTQLNGLSQGAAYGDDLQMDSNYPLIKLISQSGQMAYGRTFNWSSTGVQTGNKVVSTDFVIPASLRWTGSVSVVVIANGIASNPTSLPVVLPGQTLTFNGTSSMGASGYEIEGGTTDFQDDGSFSGYLLRGVGGHIELFDSATGGTASIAVDGGPGNGGIPGVLRFHNSSTAGAATIVDHPGVLGANFKHNLPNPIDGFAGETRFFDSSTAGTAHVSNEGESDDGAGSGLGGFTEFADNSSGDHGVFVNHSSPASNGKGGEVGFDGSATADHGIFTNLSSPTGWAYSAGRTVFFDTATGAQGTFVNVGGAGIGGTTEFRSNSTAANGTYINKGSTSGTFPNTGNTQFFDNATAGNGTFRNVAGAAFGGGTQFNGRSTAANGTFINDGADTSAGIGAGEVLFKNDSTAGNAHYHSIGVAGGNVNFHDRSSADHGTFLVDPGSYNSRIVFYNDSTASNATFEIGGSGYLQFFGSSSAGNATILMRGNGGPSYCDFSSTAGNANVTVNGAEVAGGSGGNVGFSYPGTAGNATFIVNGASVTTYGANGGRMGFDYNGSAGNSTIIVNGGTNGGPGGLVVFSRGGTGDQAHILVNAGGTLDLYGNAYYGGTSVGTLEGAGSIYLGFGNLNVGGLNSDSTISGVISDYVYIPGYLTKIGLGTVTLSGTNTYIGVTTINGGALAINGSIVGDVQVNAGTTLKGSGTIGGAVTVAPGGVVAPGNSPGTLTIKSNYLQAAQSALRIIVAGPNLVNRSLLVVKGNASLSGTLLLVFSGYAPSANETFPVMQVTGNVTSNALNIVVAGLKPGFQGSCQIVGGQVIFTANSTGQLRTTSDPVQVLPPWFTQQSEFVMPVFTVTGATYQFDTSIDLLNWTHVSQTAGANNLFEFRQVPPSTDPKRFYRVVASGP